MPIQKISFLKGLDKDSDIRYLNNAYRDAYNVRITDYQNGNKLTIVNSKGNTEKEYTPPSGYNFVIGSFDDKVNKNVYYFVYNSNNSHSILKYDYTNDVVEKVLELSGLLFTQDNKITGVALLDNRYLLFTDNNREPMKVDLENTSQYEVFNTLDQEDTLQLARKPQVLPTLAIYQTDTNKKYNNLQGNLWQFRTVVKYNDGTRSDFGAISRLAVPSIDSQSNFVTGQDVSIDNQILLSVPVPEFFSNNCHIEGVELYARGVNSDSNKGDNWFLFYEEDILSMELRYSRLGSNYADYTFANDGVYVLADTVEASQSQTFVPKKAKALDIISGNRLAMANITDGFDKVEVDGSLTFEAQAVPSAPSVGVTAMSLVGAGNTSPLLLPAINIPNTVEISNNNSTSGLTVTSTAKTISVSGTPSANDKISFALRLSYSFYSGSSSGAVNVGSFQSDFSFEYLVKNGQSASEVAREIVSLVNAEDTSYNYNGSRIGGVAGAGNKIIQGQSLNYSTNPADPSRRVTAVTTANIVSGSVTIVNLGQISTRPTFKKDAIHEFGIQYSDGKGRRSTVYSSSNFKGKTPSNTSSTASNGRITAEIQVSNSPPEWAEYWSLMYTKNQSFDYTLSFFGNVSNASGDIWNVSLADYVSFRGENEDSSINYSFVKGDVVKILYSAGGTFTNSEEFEILEFDQGNSDLKIRTSSIAAGDYIFEIRRPKKYTTEKFFYEIGYTFNVFNPIGEYTQLNGREDALLGSITSNTTTATDGTYNVSLVTTSGSGSGGRASVTVLGGAVTSIDVSNVGSGYSLNDNLNINAADIGSATDILLTLRITHEGNTQNQSNSAPAIVEVNDVGDYYYIHRPYYDNFDASPVAHISSFGEHEHFSDYYTSDVTSIGRLNSQDVEAREVNRQAAVVYSQPYIPETNVNGVSTFYGTSLEQYATQYGSIQYIYSEGKRLFLFQENKVGQIGINEQFFLDGSQQTYQTTTVLNPAQYYPAEFGIGASPESFSVFGYRKYFVDTLRGAVIRLSQDGMTPISNSGMRGIFNEILSDVRTFSRRMTYNEQFDELTFTSIPKKIGSGFIILSQTPVNFSINKSEVPNVKIGDSGVIYYDNTATAEYNVVSVVEGSSTFNVTTDAVIPTGTINYIQFGEYNVITYSEEAGAWVSKWDYKPEWLEECGIGMVSFNEGKIYLHDSNNSRGQFYGTNYPAKVTVVANENSSYPKLLKTIQQESTTQWECPSITTLEGQESNLIGDDFQKIQNQWYAAFLFDENTPNVTHPLLNGDPLRSSAMEIQMQNDSTSEEKLFSVGVNYIVSNLSNDE
tara:strand:+ start:4206 stop:8150 length:3945 start_codon:yes stop_codon:yes gene_type:complete